MSRIWTLRFYLLNLLNTKLAKKIMKENMGNEMRSAQISTSVF